MSAVYGLRMTDKEVAARYKNIIESLNKRVACWFVEINHHVSAKNHMKRLFKGKFRMHQVQLAKNYLALKRLLDLPLVIRQTLKILAFQLLW